MLHHDLFQRVDALIEASTRHPEGYGVGYGMHLNYFITTYLNDLHQLPKAIRLHQRSIDQVHQEIGEDGSIRDRCCRYSDSQLLKIASPVSTRSPFVSAASQSPKPEALDMSKLINAQRLVNSIQPLADLYIAMGEYSLCLSLLEECLTMGRACMATSPQYMNFLFRPLRSLATVWEKLGRPDKAVAVLKEDMTINRQALKDQNDANDVSLMSLANIFRLMGQNERALSLYAKARAGAHEEEIAMVHLNMGQLHEVIPVSYKG